MTCQNCNHPPSFPNNLDSQAKTKILNCNGVQLAQNGESTLHPCNLTFVFLIATHIFSTYITAASRTVPISTETMKTLNKLFNPTQHSSSPHSVPIIAAHCSTFYNCSQYCCPECCFSRLHSPDRRWPNHRCYRRFGSRSNSPGTQIRILLQ
jgi:hypothetical protein